MKRLPELFWEIFKISLFVIGGGYAIIVVADQVFARKKWTEEGELLAQLPVFQMVPGLLAAHTAVYVGAKTAGALGAVVGVLAVAVPAVGIFIFMSICYEMLPLNSPWLLAAFMGLRASLTGIIAAAVLRSAQKSLTSVFAWSVMLAALAALTLGGLAVPWVLLAAMAIGMGSAALPKRESGRRFGAVGWPLLLFLKYGLLGFGGGFVLVPMYLEDFVGASAPCLQISESLFSNIMALAQMTPGPVGINYATFFGYRLAGVPGAFIASALILLPGSVMVYWVIRSLDRFRENRWVCGLMRGIRPASISLMLIALWVFAKSSFVGPQPVAIALVSGTLIYFRKINVVLLIILSALLALVLQCM